MERLLSKKETQDILLQMLDRLVEYLEEHQLRYYLVGGTLLGAVRHKGFIPWDDDIDIGMPRKDYDRLLEIEKTEPISPGLRLISDRTGTFTNPFSELVNINTRLDRKTSEYIRRECLVTNLFIDIIPQDGWPDDESDAKRLFKKMKWMRYLLQNGRARMGQGTTVLRKLVKIPFIILARGIGLKRILNQMDQIARRYDYDSSRYVGAVTYGIYGPGERCPREQTLRFVTVEFEGKRYQAPGCWKQYLTQIYGDFMQLPPPEKRVDHRMQVWLTE